MTRETEQQLNCEVLVAGGGPAGDGIRFFEPLGELVGVMS